MWPYYSGRLLVRLQDTAFENNATEFEDNRGCLDSRFSKPQHHTALCTLPREPLYRKHYKFKGAVWYGPGAYSGIRGCHIASLLQESLTALTLKLDSKGFRNPWLYIPGLAKQGLITPMSHHVLSRTGQWLPGHRHFPPVSVYVRLNVPKKVIPYMPWMAVYAAPYAGVDFASLLEPAANSAM